MVSNFLPPDSQPWVRALENKVKTLETSITTLKKATTSRVSNAITTPGGALTLGGEKVPGEGVLNGSLEHLNGVYTLRYSHEFHGLTQYVLIVSGKASGAGELSLLGPEGQVLDSDTLETDVEDATEFRFVVEFPILTMNYEFEPEDEDGGGPDTDQEVVASYVLPDTGTISLVTGATLSELSYEIRSANSSQVTIDTSSGVPTITGLSADGTTIDLTNDYSDTLEILTEALEEAQQELADARAEAEQNFGTLDDKLGQAFPDDIFDVDLAIEQAKGLAEQKFKDSITGTVVEYAVNTSETVAPTSGWSTATPTRTPGSYVWMRTTITYGDGTPAVLSPALLTGNDGAKGATGAKGDPGSVITSSVVEYAQITSGTTRPTSWSTTVPSPVEGRYIWTRTTFKYTVGPDQYSYSVGKIGEKGSPGAPGSTGAKGDPGTTLTGTALHYTQTTSGTTIPSSGWNTTIPDPIAGRYMWTRTTWSFSDKPDQYGYSVALNGATGAKGDKGATGSTGATGVSVTAIVPHFRQDSSKPSQPSGTSPSGWSTTEPAYVAGTKLWRSERISFSNNTVQWTPVTEVATYAGIDAAMTMASGKNAVSYTDVADSIAEPGPTPTTAMGTGRRKYDMHRNRRMNGQIIGEWMWTGTAWTQLELSDAMLSSLDVGKLTAGTANIETAVVNKLWGQLGVFDKLDVRTDAYVSGINLKDGAVTARTLNVVPDSGTGGLALDAYGMDVVGPDTGEAATFVSFRADQANAISFVQDGASTFSVSPEGDLVAQSVAANESLTYRGVELAGLLGQLPQGVVSDQVAYMNTFMQLDGTERTALLCTVPARDPALGDRQYKVHVQISSNYTGNTIGLRVRYTEDGTQVKTTSPALERVIIKDDAGIYTFDLFHSAPADKELHFRLGLWSSAGVRLPSSGIATHMWVEDLGPAVPVRSFTPSQGSGGGQSATPDPTTETSTYVREFSPTWTRSFLGNGNAYNYGAGRAYHGYYIAQNGILGSAIGFNRTEIASHTASGTITEVEVFLKNSHTYSSAGMTAQFGTHSYTSAPSSFNVPAGSRSTTFKKGEGKWITLPSSMWTAWKTGSANGITLKPSTSSNMAYGYFDGTATRVRITVRK